MKQFKLGDVLKIANDIMFKNLLGELKTIKGSLLIIKLYNSEIWAMQEDLVRASVREELLYHTHGPLVLLENPSMANIDPNSPLELMTLRGLEEYNRILESYIVKP